MYAAPALVFLATAFCPMASTDAPPPLTFDKHVDYIGWFNQYVSDNKKDNAYDLYKFSASDSRQPGDLPALEGEAKDQCAAAMKKAWAPGDYPALEAYLKQCGPTFEMLKKATQREHYWQPIPPDTESLFSVVLPSLSGVRTASQTLLARAMMKQDDQSKVFIEACRTVLRTADHMHQSGFLISELLGLALRANVYQAACAAIRDGVVGDEDLATLYTTISKFDPVFVGADAPALVGEYGLFLDLLQYTCPGGKLNVERWKAVVATSQDSASLKEDQMKFDPQEALRLLNESFKQSLAVFAKPLSYKNAVEFGKIERDQAAKYKDNAFLKNTMPGLARAYQLELRTETMRRGTLLVIAIHAHHAKHGKWPESLDKIDGQAPFADLKSLRDDPYSTGEWVYKIVDDRPLLYSVSVNTKDDGGRHDPKWGEGEENSDYVVWPVQPAPAAAKPVDKDKPTGKP